jgi:GTP1/Obg family GTP-binding protein
MENKQVTKQDFESLKKELFDNFARKQDLENQKTELLEKLVDKETHKQDLENLKRELLDKLVDKDTYKKDLAKLATKDLLRWEIHEVRKDLNDFKEETNQKLDMLLSAIDGLAKLITNGQVEKAASEATFQRHEQWLEDHERRIERIEMKSA